MKYLIDSCLWIDHFQGENDRLSDRIDKLLDSDAVYANGIVLGEILYGARDERAFEILSDTLHGLHLLDDSCGVTVEAAKLGFQLRRRGITVPLSDLIIATQCLDNDLQLLTVDRHFEPIIDHTELKCDFFKD